MKVGKYFTEAASGAAPLDQRYDCRWKIGYRSCCVALLITHVGAHVHAPPRSCMPPKSPFYRPHEKDCILVRQEATLLDREGERIKLLDHRLVGRKRVE